MRGSSAQAGTRPQRRSSSTRRPPRSWRIAATCWPGATLKRACSCGVSASAKRRASSSGVAVRVKRPHTVSSPRCYSIARPRRGGEPVDPEPTPPPALLAVRGVVGGLLLGLANLVPGISGGTMLLASGLYPGFIGSIAELSRLRFRPRSVLLLGAILATAGLVILLLAGRLKGLIEEQSWVLYSLFVGLTLGGVPLLWRMARPASLGFVFGAAVAFGATLLMAFGGTSSRGGDDAGYGLLFVTGVAASSAMILPGVSGGTLLLLLGQYEPILGSIDQLERGLFG